jgi:hypothetical protein
VDLDSTAPELAGDEADDVNSSKAGGTMAGATVQQVVEYLKAHPEVAAKAREYVKQHPGELKAALKEVAEKRGWDLSNIDTNALKNEIGKLH